MVKKTAGGFTAVPGFQAVGTAAGIKKHNGKDLALLVAPGLVPAAGVFTQNSFAAAPVQITKRRVETGFARAIVANSGCANACTGLKGLEDAERMAALAGEALGCASGEVMVASTGVIGEYLPMLKIAAGIKAAAKELSADGGRTAAEAIMTTDTVPKEYACQEEIGGKTVTFGGMAKGSGMIHPNMATMLSFIACDAVIERSLLAAALRRAAAVSFNMITVDGDTSTNDMLLVLAGLTAGNPVIKDIEGEDFRLFTAALSEVCIRLAQAIVRDAEGATKFIEVRVKGCRDFASGRTAALSILSSNLVKTAIFGEDANWGRIIMALGNSGIPFVPDKVAVSLGDIPVAAGGMGLAFDEDRAKEVLARKDIQITVDLGLGREEAVGWGSDLSYDYVKINGSYRT